MNKNERENREHIYRLHESGQVLVIAALLLIGLLAMAALLLDGGNTYLKRRRAQNAADAGALAGGDILCAGGTSTQVVDKALEYVGLNEAYADAGDVSIIDSRQVGVQTSITFDTFFAHLIGWPQITVEAEAVAACFPAGGATVLPVAWSCRPPEEGEWDSDDCRILYGDPEGDYPHPDQKYIVMDDYKLGEDLSCLEPGEPAPDPPDPNIVDCDVDDDGFNDILRGGDRSWLDLDWDSANAAELTDWIAGDEVPNLMVHTWLRSSTATDVSVYHTALTREGEDVVIPVFDMICNDGDPSGAEGGGCPEKVGAAGEVHIARYGPGIEDEIRAFGGEQNYFHIISFAVFHIDCVKNKPSKTNCPVTEAAVTAELIDHNTHTIEGYFKKGFIPGHSGDPDNWVDTGSYTVYLVK